MPKEFALLPWENSRVCELICFPFLHKITPNFMSSLGRLSSILTAELPLGSGFPGTASLWVRSKARAVLQLLFNSFLSSSSASADLHKLRIIISVSTSVRNRALEGPMAQIPPLPLDLHVSSLPCFFPFFTLFLAPTPFFLAVFGSGSPAKHPMARGLGIDGVGGLGPCGWLRPLMGD